MYVGQYKPEWERGLFTYLILISLAALVESAATDWDQASQRKEADGDDT
jgi:hypothetical protein